MVIRIASVGLSLLSVSISLSYLGNRSYGIWVTLSSLSVWVNFFDFGLLNSLQSQLAQAIAAQKIEYARSLISTSYAIMLRYVVPVLSLIVVGISLSLNWSTLLYTGDAAEPSLTWAIALLGCFTTLQLTLKSVSAIFFAYQKTRFNELVNFVIQALMVMLVAVLRFVPSRFIDPFLAVVLINALIPVLVWSFVSLCVYTRMYPALSPSIRSIQWHQTRTLLRTGFHFTILQLYGIVLFFTDNILIAYLFGADSVTEYSIIMKYFSVLTLFFGMILMPYWSAVATTYDKNDSKGTINLMRTVSGVFLVIVAGGGIQFLLKDYVIKLWTGLTIVNYFYLALWILIATLLAMFNNIYTIFLNSVGKLRLQVIVAIAVIFLNPFLSILAVKVFQFRIEAIPVVNILCLLLYGSVAIVQVVKLLQNRATGIWNK